jgi:hypothetical protein
MDFDTWCHPAAGKINIDLVVSGFLGHAEPLDTSRGSSVTVITLAPVDAKTNIFCRFFIGEEFCASFRGFDCW